MLTLVNDNGNWYYTIKDGWYYDSDRYELVEKKDWKVNNLKEQIEKNKKLLRHNSDLINYYQDLETEYANKILKLEKELKELEKE